MLPSGRSWGTALRELGALTRIRLSAAVGGSALMGYVLSPQQKEGAFILFLGTLLLAGGCSALNQVQEADTDALMQRTRRRPVASGRMRRLTGLLAALVCLASGLLLLAAGGAIPLALGAFSALWYNGLYTPLKKRSACAILPGALCGALPPLIGWSWAGGESTDRTALLLAGCFLLWQIPHFWHLALRWSADYRRAGLPTVCDLFTERQGKRILVVWVQALMLGSIPLLLCAAPLQESPSLLLPPLFLGSVLFLAALRRITPAGIALHANLFFIALNAFLLAENLLS